MTGPLSVAASPAFWVAVVAYCIASVLAVCRARRQGERSAGSGRVRRDRDDRARHRYRLARRRGRAPGRLGPRGARLPRVHHHRRLRAREHALPADTRRRRRDAGVARAALARAAHAGGRSPRGSVGARPDPHLARDARRRHCSRSRARCRRSTSSRIARSSARSSTAAAFKDREAAPLEPLDQLAHRLVWVGFPIFTIALVLGAVWTSRLGQDLGGSSTCSRW